MNGVMFFIIFTNSAERGGEGCTSILCQIGRGGGEKRGGGGKKEVEDRGGIGVGWGR